MNHNWRKKAGLILLTAATILAFSLAGCGKTSRDSKDAINKSKKGSLQQDALTEEFFKKYGDYFENGWKPDRILNYSETGEFVNEDGKFTDEDLQNCKLGYIQKITDHSVEIKEVDWILDEKEPNGFRVEDKGGNAVWLAQIFSMRFHIRIWSGITRIMMWKVNCGIFPWRMTK